jgi:hypothetical protein
MSTKLKYNKYPTFETYKGVCPSGYHHHPGNPKSNSKGCMKNSDMKEKFGGFSLSAAVRRPFNQSRWDPNYKEPVVAGVN